MAKFLNTSGVTYHLEELIKNAKDRLILISPYLQFNDKIKELLEDKNRLKIDIRIIYGKSELQPIEINWLKGLDFVRTSFCKNLHAKCYLNESECIITSLNLYEFSQVNNNEMGVLIFKNEDNKLYNDTYDEAQRIIRISDEVRLSVDKPITPIEELTTASNDNNQAENVKQADTKQTTNKNYSKITTAKLAEKFNIEPKEFRQLLCKNGYIEIKGKNDFLTDKGREIGGEVKKGQYGYFIVWSVDLEIDFDEKQSFADKLLGLFR